MIWMRMRILKAVFFDLESWLIIDDEDEDDEDGEDDEGPARKRHKSH